VPLGQLVEGVEELLADGRRDAVAVIDDAHGRLAIGASGVHLDLVVAAVGCCFGGVVQQVGHDAVQERRVCPHDALGRVDVQSDGQVWPLALETVHAR
jgi:hypothetical protein